VDGKTTVKYLQKFIKQTDYHSELLKTIFASRPKTLVSFPAHNAKKPENGQSCGAARSIGAEFRDAIYDAITIANLYDIDL